jgi:hypothetical protein
MPKTGTWIQVYLEDLESRENYFKMTYDVTSYYLNKIIEKEIKYSLEIFWQSNRVCWLDWNYFFGGQEIKVFIFSSPYFSEDLKEFLYNPENFVFLEVTEEWYNKFIEIVYLWAESDEWLNLDSIFTTKTLTEKNDLIKLDLPRRIKNSK